MAFAISYVEPFPQSFFMITSESEPHTRTHTAKRLARRACLCPPALSRVTFMRDAHAPAAGHSTHFNPHHWLLCHMGLYYFEFEFE
jgi:hypothetical protein